MNWESNKTQLKTDWDTNGYVVVKNFMNLKDVSNLRTEIERYISDVVPNVPENEVMYEDNQKTETLKRLGHMSWYDDYFSKLVQEKLH